MVETNQSENNQASVNIVQGVEITYKVDCNKENFWWDFEVPFNMLSQHALEELATGIKTRNTLYSLIHLTVDKMRDSSKVIPTKAFKIVAKKIMDRYPDTFKDTDEDGVVLGDGTHSLFCKLQDRNNYLNRPHKAKRSNENPTTSKKRCVSARAGCSNWAPDVIAQTNEEVLENVRTMPDTDLNYERVLNETFPDIRMYLNAEVPPTISKIKEDWPILFSKKSIAWHFNKLTNSDINLLDQMRDKGQKIIDFIEKKKNLKYSDDEQEEPELKLIRIISLYFKERIEDFLHSAEKLPNDDEREELPVYPFIMKLDSTEENAEPRFYLYVEKNLIHLDGYETFIEAFKIAMAIFFILNLRYVRTLETTLELVQRYFLKIHPDAGSKTKKATASKRKVLNLLSNLKQ
ncbi:unnamed protein product [Callosobruchus maculatus]|uniref:Uncharacterized protein n=1 Tax=Callosobruchus maculatus TaxID=64391 RepID=A0A653DTN4_CALMS|nr:unnamed protein product [Callosobruchus maculatus]